MLNRLAWFLAWTSMRVAMISVAFLSRPHGLQLARTAIASMDRLGSDQMRTGHAVGTVDPPQMTQSGGSPLIIGALRKAHSPSMLAASDKGVGGVLVANLNRSAANVSGVASSQNS